ncbi:MAG: AI-2E family transporter [Alphaproteobacteria bacterium]|nr:AI-2E family transporter [Alphaproteobacteria bacterium]
MTLRNHIFFWLGTFLAFMGFLYIFNSVLMPFVLGLAIAYLLNPLVMALGKIKIHRGVAALMILLVFFALVGLFVALAAPVLYRQSLDFIDALPGYAQNLWELAQPTISKIGGKIGIYSTTDINVKELLANNSETTADIAKRILGQIAAGGQAVIGTLTNVIFTPIVAYFVMKEWVHITNWVEDLLPRDNKDTIIDLLKQIDKKISGFIRGQISVAVILGIAYAVALTIAGLKYGALIGLAAGMLSIIPMVGSSIGLVVSVVVAYFQSYDLVYVGIIAGIFLGGQLIEGNILSPKIIGDSVGLHPLWVFFALLAGGALFGIVGMLIAVPIAAAAGVLMAYAISRYKSSPIYQGKPKAKKITDKAKG